MTERVKRAATASDAQALANCIAQAATDKKAENVVILDLRKLDSMTDFFVICTGEVDQHVRAIADNIQDSVKKQTGDRLMHREGRESSNWVLLDYVDVVAHVMKPAYREYYRLEDLWGDAEEVRLKRAAAKRTSKATQPKAVASSEQPATRVHKPKPSSSAPPSRVRKPTVKKSATPKTKRVSTRKTKSE